jgi:tRNA(Ser,Leu) C12 N-acetylase TAN1
VCLFLSIVVVVDTADPSSVVGTAALSSYTAVSIVCMHIKKKKKKKSAVAPVTYTKIFEWKA